MGELIDHILSTHHRYLKAQLPHLSARAAEVEAGAGQLPAAADVTRVLRDLREELEAHLMKEEMVLFPMVRGMEAAEAAGGGCPPMHCGSVRNPIRVMSMEHDSAHAALGELRRLTGGYALPENAGDALRSFYGELQELEADLELHIGLENDILFPRAVELEAHLFAGR